jgi:hypothetical protein
MRQRTAMPLQKGHAIVVRELLSASFRRERPMIGELAGRAGVGLSTASRSIAQLATHGLVEKLKIGSAVHGEVVDFVAVAELLASRTAWHQDPRFSDEHFPANATKVAQLQEWCNQRGWSTAAVAVAWGLSRSPSIISIPGTRTAAHLEQFVGTADIEPSSVDLAEIDAIMPPGWAHGARYSEAQNVGPEQYC